MNLDATWLLKKQSFLRAREIVLKTWIAATGPPSDVDLIDEITFSHGSGENVQHVPSQNSRTEYAALNLERLKDDDRRIQERRLELWNRELRQIQNWLAVLDAALMVLTPEEKILVDRYYNEGKSIEALSLMPLLDVIRSRSTLKRMLKTITAKVSQVIASEMDDETSP